MTLPATPPKPTRNGKPEPKSPHLSRAERRKEKNFRKQIIKQETAKHQTGEGKQCEKNASKRANKRANKRDRKAAKSKARATQKVAEAVSDTPVKTSTRQHGTVSRAPSIFNPTPETAKAIADAALSSSPSCYTRKVGTPLLPSPSQGGHCKVERILTDDFLRVREADEKDERAPPSSPNSAPDLVQHDNDEWIGLANEIEGQGSEYDFPQTIHPGAFIEFFGGREEKHKPELKIPDSRGGVEATHVNNVSDWNKFIPRRKVQWIKREGDPHRIAFDEQGNELRGLSYYGDFDSNESDPGSGHNPSWEDLDFRANPLGDDFGGVRGVAVLSDGETDGDVEELPYIDLTQEDTVMVDSDAEDDVDGIEPPARGWATPDHIIDLTEDSDAMKETYGDGSGQGIDTSTRDPVTSVITDLTQDDDSMDEAEDEDGVQPVDLPTPAPARTYVDLPALAPPRNRVDLPAFAPASIPAGVTEDENFMGELREEDLEFVPEVKFATASNHIGDGMKATREVKTSAVAPTAARPVDAMAGSSQNNPQVIDDDSEEAHEAKLELCLQKELLRAQECREAKTKEAKRLEQLLKYDHSSLAPRVLSDEVADVRDPFVFIVAMRAEQSDLNTKASILEKELKSLLASGPLSAKDMTKARNLSRLWHANEMAATHMIICENKFRDRAGTHDQCWMREMFEEMRWQLLTMFDDYDKFLKKFNAKMGGEAKR